MNDRAIALNHYNVAEAHRAAILSDAAYGDTLEAKTAAIAHGADDAALIEVGSVEMLAAKFGPDVVLAFRGTAGFRDLIADVGLVLGDSPELPGETHAGFTAGVELALPDALDAIDKLRGRDGFVSLCGHSKGGAEAVLMAMRLHAAGVPGISTVFTFGAPAVGDREFAREFDRVFGLRTFAHVFASDWIARSPFILRLVGRYVPVGLKVYLTRAGVRTFRPSPLRLLIDAVRAVSRRRGIADHSIENYIGGTT